MVKKQRVGLLQRRKEVDLEKGVSTVLVPDSPNWKAKT